MIFFRMSGSKKTSSQLEDGEEEDVDMSTVVHLIRSQESFDKLNQYEVPPKERRT